MKKTLAIALVMTGLALTAGRSASADDYTKPTILTFNHAVEIPGTVLPAGTYMFTLADVYSDRYLVRVFNKDGSKLLATVMTITDYRLTASNQPVLEFKTAPAGAPQPIRAFFYPGERFGREFVYPKDRALGLAASAKVIVPALGTDVVDPADLKSVAIVAVTPTRTEVPVATVIQTNPAAATDAPRTAVAAAQVPPADAPAATARQTTPRAAGRVNETGQTARADETLPKTASPLPLIALFGFISITAAFAVLALGKRATVPAK